MGADDLESISMEDIRDYARKLGVDLSQVDLDSIPLPPHFDDDQVFLNDIARDIDVGGDCEENRLNDFSNVIVVDDLPIIGPDKFDRLEAEVRKEYDKIKIGMIKPDGFWMPINPETQETLGYCFIEFNTREEAELAKNKTHGHKLDTRHKIAVTLMEEFDRLINTPEEFIVPDSDEKPSICQENLQHWLTDYRARDQYCVHAGEQLEVYWNDTRLSEPEFLHSLEIESLVQWSPLGTYLAVGDKGGVSLYGSAASFCPLIHFAHPQVKLFDFSPGEKYLLTYDISSSPSPKSEQTTVLRIFDVRKGRVIRSFRKKTDANGPSSSSIRWSGGRDDMYFASMKNNILHVYETQNFLTANKSLRKIGSVQSFSWSPTDSILAVSIEESHDQPSRVILLDVQKKQELRQKTLFNVNLSNMCWQSNGDYLAIHVDYKKRTAKGNESAIYIFWIREPDIPVEILELETDNDKIIEFSWEPKGQSFGVIHGNNMRPDISFYSLKKTSNTCKFLKLRTLRSKQANTLQWSPAGRFVVIAGLKHFGGKLEFFDGHEFKTSAMTEHYLATGITWDPTGRYVATSVSSINEFENGFILWSFYGKMLYQMQMEHLHQFQWRPRPPSLLSAEKELNIEKKLKDYVRKYEAEEREIVKHVREQEDQRKKMLIDEWQGWVMKWKKLQQEEKLLRSPLNGGDTSDDEEDELEAVVEEEVDEFEEELLYIDENIILDYY